MMSGVHAFYFFFQNIIVLVYNNSIILLDNNNTFALENIIQYILQLVNNWNWKLV